jgi:hypothetical protein
MTSPLLAQKAGRWVKGKAKQLKESLSRDDDECDDESDNEDHCEEERRGGRALRRRVR